MRTHTFGITFATSLGDYDAFSIIDLKLFSTFYISEKYGDSGSKAFFDEALEFIMLVLITPGLFLTTLIPNGSSSYYIDSLNPSKANFVL